MPREKLRVRDVQGQWVEIDPAEVRPPPIRHTALKKTVLERIALVHEALHDVLVAPNDQPLSLEQFELKFMRSQSPADELKLWEAIALTLDKAQGLFPPDEYDRKSFYRRVVLAICGALTDQELHEEHTTILLRCFQSSYPRQAVASSNQAAVSSMPTGTANEMCIVCCKRVTRAGAAFCPRCGRRLWIPSGNTR